MMTKSRNPLRRLTVLAGLLVASVAFAATAPAAVMDVPFWTGAQADATGVGGTSNVAYTQVDSGVSLTWEFVSSGAGVKPPAAGTAWNWADPVWNDTNTRWERTSANGGVNDKAPTYADANDNILRVRQSSGYNGVLTVRVNQDGVYSIGGQAWARYYTGGSNTTTRVYKVSADRKNTTQLMNVVITDSSAYVDFGAEAGVQNISLLANEYLVFSFTPNGGTGSLYLGNSPTGGTDVFISAVIPEPASLGLLAVCGAGLLSRRRRR